jgi:hypothetical protein
VVVADAGVDRQVLEKGDAVLDVGGELLACGVLVEGERIRQAEG